MSYFNMPNGMSNEDLEYFDSPDPEFNECRVCGSILRDFDEEMCDECFGTEDEDE